MRFVALALAVAFATPAWSEGPGSRLRTTPEVPAPPTSKAPAPGQTSSESDKRCEALSGERKDRCLSEMRAGRRTSGPEATGMGSGAGSSAGSGTTGGASFGGSAPR